MSSSLPPAIGPLLIFAFAVPFLTGGCGRAGAHDDRLEHHVPPHKPANLAAAAEAIPRRWKLLETIGTAGNPEARHERWQELLDIVRWLPELAGDSDLPEEHWNRVNAISQQLIAQLQPAVQRLATDPHAALPPLASSELLLAELRPIVAAEQAPANSANEPGEHP
jgi:hypothetical protein